MKKLLILVTLILTSILSSCTLNDLLDSGKLVEVDSVTLKDFEGKDFIVDYSWDFYDVADYVVTVLGRNQAGVMIEINSKLQFAGETEESLSGVIYNKNYITYVDAIVHVGEDGPAEFKKYDETLVDSSEQAIGKVFYSKFQYNSELAIGGQEYYRKPGEYKNELYYSEEYPSQPKAGTKLLEKYSSFEMFTKLKGTIKVIEFFMPETQYIDENGERMILDFESHDVGSYKLYKDYIILEQDSPFPLEPIGSSVMVYNYYKNSLENGYNFKRTIKYNYKTNMVESIKYEGYAIFDISRASIPATFEMTLDYKKIDEEKFSASFNELKQYVRDNTVVRS